MTFCVLRTDHINLRKLTMNFMKQHMAELSTHSDSEADPDETEDAMVIEEATKSLNGLLVCTMLAVFMSCCSL